MLRLILKTGLLLLFVMPLWVCPALPAGSLGDAVPELQVREWVKDGPVSLKDGLGKNIFVIEFWQTECPHCLESLPYLSVLQEQYKNDGVILIGVTVEDPKTVRTFLKENQDVNYAVAVDDDEKTYDRFMSAFGISGVPHAFVIGRQGRILWEGHPLDHLAEILAQIVAGRYDLAAAQNVSRARKLLAAYIYLSDETDENDITREVGERVIAYGQKNAGVMHKLARFIVTDKANRKPDVELGVKAAKLAHDLTGGKDWEVLETYAGALSLIGEAKKAKVYLQKANALKCVQGAENPTECNPGE